MLGIASFSILGWLQFSRSLGTIPRWLTFDGGRNSCTLLSIGYQAELLRRPAGCPEDIYFQTGRCLNFGMLPRGLRKFLSELCVLCRVATCSRFIMLAASSVYFDLSLFGGHSAMIDGSIFIYEQICSKGQYTKIDNIWKIMFLFFE